MGNCRQAYLVYNGKQNRQTLIVDWNKVSYIGIDGVYNRVKHRDVSARQANAVQTVFYVPSGTKINDFLVPVSGNYKELYKFYTDDINIRNAHIKSLLGKNATIYFPIIIEDKEIEYRFIFHLNRVNVEQKNPDFHYSFDNDDVLPTNKHK